MSTRAQIIVKGKYEEVWFYRHSDGYPEGTMPTLTKFLDWVKSGRIRDDAIQASGWLVIIGHLEYQEQAKAMEKRGVHDANDWYPKLNEPTGGAMGWKVGAYEPCAPKRHGDIEYLYTVNLTKLTISHIEV